MAYTLLGNDFTPPDIRAKVTGEAKYSEDFRVDGMVYARLLTSPMPHARVRNIDASEALAMPGVIGILTADDVPAKASPQQTILTNEPVFVGDPILAVAAESETIAQDAIDKIKIDFEPLPFCVDPLESLYPGGPNARSEGNSVNLNFGQSIPPEINNKKWTARDFAAVEEGQLPTGEPTVQWEYGDLDSGFEDAALVLEESFVVASNSHHSMEPRSALSYWENGKCHVFGSLQSQSFAMYTLAGLIGIPPEDVVFVAEFCGGGFGSKGNPYPSMVIPAHFSKKINRPVMLRISRAEEYYLGYARCGFQGRTKIGFREDGKVTSLDLYLVQENGSATGFPDINGFSEGASLVYTPEAMRLRGIFVSTNTPPRAAQRGPGQNQMAVTFEPLMDRAAKELGVDRLAIRQINAPTGDALVGAGREPVTSAHPREALMKGAEQFNWAERVKSDGQRNGSKVRSVAVATAFHPAGFNGFDGLVVITPDGKLNVHTGVGNLGTYSYASTSRVAAEVLKYDWENCVIHRGDSRKHLPFNIGQFGSNTSFTMTRTNFVAATDAMNKIKEIAAMDMGGDPGDYDIGEEKVFSTSDPTESMTYAEVAQRAIELGGKYSGIDGPEDINPITKGGLAGVAGTGLVGVAKDKLEKHGLVPAFCAGFIDIELDTETGKFEILDYLGVVDCGTVLHPQSLATQIKGGAVMGFGMAATEKLVYDPQNGLPVNVGLYQAKPPSYLDVPSTMDWAAVDEPDPQNPVGAKGVGEPVMGGGAASLICAISNALDGHYFMRNPITPDMIINAAAGRPQSYKPLQVNNQ
jgi:xanthine dehydrogenase molybdenum-binding subunit